MRTMMTGKENPMAVRVKVSRLKLIARLEGVRDQSKKKHAEALRKWNVELRKARRAAASDLRKKAATIANDTDIYVASERVYRERGERQNMLVVESPVVIPAKPEPHRALRSIEYAIELLNASDDDKVSIGTGDMLYYGIASITDLEDE